MSAEPRCREPLFSNLFGLGSGLQGAVPRPPNSTRAHGQRQRLQELVRPPRAHGRGTSNAVHRYGGFVKWEMGVKEDGSDSIAVQVTRTFCAPRCIFCGALVTRHLSPVIRHTSHASGRARISLARTGRAGVRCQRKQEGGVIHKRHDEQVPFDD